MGSAAQLAQQPPPSLPSAPILDRLLLENPLPAVLVSLLGALVALWVLRRMGRGRWGLVAGLLGVALAIGCFVLASLVETPREALKAQSRALVDAAARADRDALDELLHSVVQVRLTGAGIRLDSLDKQGVIDRTEEYMDGAYALEEWGITSLQAIADGPEVGRTLLRVRVIPEATRFPTFSWWAIDWERIGSAWRAAEIELIQVDRGF